jgi:hypothetical protein
MKKINKIWIYPLIAMGFVFILTGSCKKDAPNNPPAFPVSFQFSSYTQYQYDDNGSLKGAITTITIPAAIDPDGDQLSYAWVATNGTITGNGLTGTWQQIVSYGHVQSGDVTVTVSDGKGGSDYRVFQF